MSRTPSIEVKTAPVGEPVTLDKIKIHARVDGNDDDGLLAALITSAREYCEAVQGRAYLVRTLIARWDELPATLRLDLPFAPLAAVDSVKITDENGVETTLAAASYHVDTKSQPGRLVFLDLSGWPATLDTTGAIAVEFRCGYGTAADVPRRMKQAIMLLAAYWYATREAAPVDGRSQGEAPLAVHALLQLDRLGMV